MLFDVHAHYDDEKFDNDRDEILSQMLENNVGHIINIGVDIETSEFSIALSKKYPFIYAAVGFHPSEVLRFDNAAADEIVRLAGDEKVVAIGEIGLDYHYEKETAEVQKKAFATQIGIAADLNLPFQVHSREATMDTMDILRGSAMCDRRGIFHCFSGSKDTARDVLNLGMKISVGGTLTFKNNVKTTEVVKYVPLSELMLETDCPYLAPTPYRGQRNSSLYIHMVAEKIAEIKGISVQEVVETTERNAMEFFNITR